jgi:hypothetical protein
MPPYFEGQPAAQSTAKGTTLPRAGMFWGVRAPRRHSTVVVGELGVSSENETPIRGWRESHEHLIEQTTAIGFREYRQKLVKLGVGHTAFMVGGLAWDQASTEEYWQSTSTPFVRGADAAWVIIPGQDEPTESPWRRLRDALAPLRASSTAVLEAIRAGLEQDTVSPDQSRHVGLAAVSWLTRILGLSRPTILRMGGVPESTFYAWRNNPRSNVRSSSVNRLLRLQAQIGLMAEAHGPSAAKVWVLTGDHVSRLQGDDAEFSEALSEAEEALKETTRIRPRPRVRLSDYESDREQHADASASEFPNRPQATKLPDELEE